MKVCRKCKTALKTRLVPCPDGRPDCLVAHYESYCPQCVKPKPLPTFEAWYTENYGEMEGTLWMDIYNRLGEYITEMVRRSVG